MDRAMAERMGRELIGKAVHGWQIEGVINYGKSALVLKGSRNGQSVAVKVFDRELVERYGDEAQRTRVLRERELIGQKHPNLIEILDAGEDKTLKLFFIVMAYLPWKNLGQVISLIPRENIHPLIKQIASAARFLEGLGLAHRDIKPENIAVSDDFATAILLDLGVIRPIGLGNITDTDEQKNFVGTLQYGPPEFLTRDEADTDEGWRAVTFYQLGAVLHDLIMRRAIFAEHTTPYPRLVEAVKHNVPRIQSEDVPNDLVLLARNCLIKDPDHRLKLVSWEAFERPPASNTDVSAARQRIATRLERARLKETLKEAVNLTEQAEEIATAVQTCIQSVLERGGFSPSTLEHSIDGDGALIRLTFSAAARCALAYPLTLFVTISPPVGPEAIISVSVAAKLMRNREEPTASRPPTERLSLLYSGGRDDGVLCKRLEEFIILSWDEAQASSDEEMASDIDEKWLLTLTEGSHGR